VNLTLWDLVLTPAYLLILGLVAKGYRDRHYKKGHPLRKYYLSGLFVKFAGAIFIALIYEYYYRNGDTFYYFGHAKTINSALHDSFSTWFNLILRNSPDDLPQLYPYSSQMIFYRDPASYSVGVVAAILGLLNGTTYIPIALLFAYLSYTGIWAMYRTFVNIYPHLIKQLAVAFLFIPSVFVWGSAIFKDTICMFALGWLTYSTFRIFINRDLSIKNLLLTGFCFFLIFRVKAYILLAFVPGLSLWLLLTYSRRIRMIAVRWMVNLGFFAFTISSFLFFTKMFAEDLNKYSLDNLLKTAETTRSYIIMSTEQEGSRYDLGNYPPTPLGILSKFPEGVVVTLFRPFLWEARKPIMVLSSLEGLAFMIMTIIVFYRMGIGKTFKAVLRDPNLSFFLIFSLNFAFAVGISTGNFGTLSRYKIPCMPFFAAFLMILYHKSKNKVILNPIAKNEKRAVRHLA